MKTWAVSLVSVVPSRGVGPYDLYIMQAALVVGAETEKAAIRRAKLRALLEDGWIATMGSATEVRR